MDHVEERREVARPIARENRAKLKALTWALATVVLFAIFGMTLGIGYLAWQANEQSKSNFDVITSVEDTQRRIISCTEPGGRCFKDGEKRTAEAVVGIEAGTLRVIVAALSCQADGIRDEKPLAECTAKRAAQSARGE